MMEILKNLKLYIFVWGENIYSRPFNFANLGQIIDSRILMGLQYVKCLQGNMALNSILMNLLCRQMVDADDADPGDHNSNDLVLSCPYFRNELGGEEERFVSLNIVTAQQQVQQLLGNAKSKCDDQFTNRSSFYKLYFGTL